jgi:hypothetical protein
VTGRARLLSGVGAAVGAFLIDVWPVLLVWRAGASGSVGDLSEVRFLGVGLAYSLALAVVVGLLMVRALELAASAPRLGRLDPWGAYALGLGVYNLALTAVPAIMYGLLLADENQSLRSREWLVYVLWIGGHLGAAVVGYAAARGLLGRGLREAQVSAVADPGGGPSGLRSSGRQG